MEIDAKAIEARIVEQATADIVNRLFDERLASIGNRVVDLFESTVEERCESAIKPIMEQGIQEFVLQRTNEFGEKKGEPITFAEYLTSLANAWLNEQVDYQGKTQTGSYPNRSEQTRLTYLLKEHMRWEIEKHMKDACEMVINQIAPAIATTCELKVKEATNQIRRAMDRR
jgi:hypothetical protein